MSGITGNCTVLREAFAVAAPTVLPLAYAQAASPVGAMYAAEAVRADGTFVYALNASARSAVYAAAPRMALRNASFPQGTYLSLHDGAAVVWDHCAQLQHAAADSRPRVELRAARGLYAPGAAAVLECAPADDGAAWTRLKDVGHGTTAAALPGPACCRVRLAYHETAADPDAPPYWALLAYTLTAPLPRAPAHDVHGAQLVFVPYTGDVVKAALAPAFAAAPAAFDFRAGATYTVPVVLQSATSVAVEVRTRATNVAVADAPRFISIEAPSYNLSLTRLLFPSISLSFFSLLCFTHARSHTHKQWSSLIWTSCGAARRRSCRWSLW